MEQNGSRYNPSKLYWNKTSLKITIFIDQNW